jgi:hypothetical protein
MVCQDTLDPAVIDRHVIAVSDKVGQLTHGKRMGDRQPDNLLLDMVGQQLFNGRLAPRMQHGALVQQAEEPLALKAPPITPETPIIDPRVLTLLTEGAFPCQDRTQRFITG